MTEFYSVFFAGLFFSLSIWKQTDAIVHGKSKFFVFLFRILSLGFLYYTFLQVKNRLYFWDVALLVLIFIMTALGVIIILTLARKKKLH